MSVDKRGYLSRLQTLLGLFNFAWHSQNEVDNVGILWRDHEKLYYGIFNYESYFNYVMYPLPRFYSTSTKNKKIFRKSGNTRLFSIAA